MMVQNSLNIKAYVHVSYIEQMSISIYCNVKTVTVWQQKKAKIQEIVLYTSLFHDVCKKNLGTHVKYDVKTDQQTNK